MTAALTGLPRSRRVGLTRKMATSCEILEPTRGGGGGGGRRHVKHENYRDCLGNVLFSDAMVKGSDGVRGNLWLGCCMIRVDYLRTGGGGGVRDHISHTAIDLGIPKTPGWTDMPSFRRPSLHFTMVDDRVVTLVLLRPADLAMAPRVAKCCTFSRRDLAKCKYQEGNSIFVRARTIAVRDTHWDATLLRV